MYAGRRAANTTTATTSTATNNGGSNSNSGMRNKSSGTARAKESQQQQQQFHPKLIATQIVALQCFHYFLLTVFLQINSVLYGKSVTIDRIFTDKHVKLWHTNGWADAFAILLASLAGAVMLAVIVEKSKKCLDFAVTLFFLHLVISTFYGGFPTRLDWWVVHIAATILMVLLGEYLCSRRELDEIPLLQL